MRILFAAIDSQFIHSNLALRYLLKLSEKSDFESELMETTVNENIDQVLEALISYAPELVVLSCYIWNITFIEQLIRALKLVRPDLMIACGGPEVAYDAQAFLTRCPADFVMAGEGEAIFPGVLSAFEKAQSENSRFADTLCEVLSEQAGLYLRQGDEIRFTGAVPLVDMSTVPFPYDEESLQQLNHRIVYYEGQRGCPYGCTYCLSSIDRSLRHKPAEMVKRELKVFMEAGVPLVKFVDRTFNVREDWAYEILRFILEETLLNKYPTSFHFEVGAATLSDRLIALFNECPPGLFQIEAGIQSTDPRVLELIERRDHPDRLRAALTRIIAPGNVHVHTDLIVGLPGDTMDTFRTSFNECIRMKPQMLQVGFLKVLKGTPLALAKERYGIVHRPWPPYEVLKTYSMSFDEIQQIKKIEKVLDKFYNSGKFSNSMKYLLMIYEESWKLFTNIAKLLSKYQKGGGAVRFEDYYSLLKDLGELLNPQEREILGDLLRFDYILSNRKGLLPERLRSEIYNSRRVRLLYSENESLVLKGTVAGFKIDVLRFQHKALIVPKESFVFYSLESDELIPVNKITDDKFVSIT